MSYVKQKLLISLTRDFQEMPDNSCVPPLVVILHSRMRQMAARRKTVANRSNASHPVELKSQQTRGISPILF